jgi:hypothetical protein
MLKILSKSAKSAKSAKSTKKTVSLQQAYRTAVRLRLNLEVISLQDWTHAMQVEMEHRNVTGGSLLTTGRIALAHLEEFPDYYDRLERMEKEAKSYWRKKSIPSTLLRSP